MTPMDLLSAYREASGLPVSMSYQRESMLSDLVSRGVSPEDVKAVILELKKRISRDTRGTYTPTCLEFRNAMDPDTMEERALTLRQKRKRVQEPPAQQERCTNGLRILDDPPKKEVPQMDLRAGLIDLANNLKKPA